MTPQFHSNLPNVQQEVCIETSKFTDGQIPQTIAVTYNNRFTYSYTFLRVDERGNYCYQLMQTKVGAVKRKKKVVPPVCPPITFSPTTIPPAQAGVLYGPIIITASGGTGPYTFTTEGLHALFTITPVGTASVELTGNPVATDRETRFTLTATDARGCTGSQTYIIIVQGNGGGGGGGGGGN